MKREHSYITILAILNCLLLWSVFRNYKIVRKEVEKEIIIEKQIDTVVDTKKVVKLEKKVKWYKKQLKVERRENDSLSAENIRKDGIIGGEEMFPKKIWDEKRFPNLIFIQDTPKGVEFTEPFTYLMNNQNK